MEWRSWFTSVKSCLSRVIRVGSYWARWNWDRLIVGIRAGDKVEIGERGGRGLLGVVV